MALEMDGAVSSLKKPLRRPMPVPSCVRWTFPALETAVYHKGTRTYSEQFRQHVFLPRAYSTFLIISVYFSCRVRVLF